MIIAVEWKPKGYKKNPKIFRLDRESNPDICDYHGRRNALSIELIKPTGKQAMVEIKRLKIYEQTNHIFHRGWK